ncbi:NADPH-dependent FMN reductase [Salinirubellus sp. GCM10025818]|jgi:NAD(P)H-dependent FMN reductase|uniref:NADPH-dependent FMN reductase n=1 Tax=Salinirubellus TaxID=2162630 RepID=UPI0030D1C018
MNTHVVAIPGSLREVSYTRLASRRVLDAAESRGATTDLIDLRSLDLPVYDGDAGGAGDADELARRVREADAVLLATPVYHGSYSAPLKNALDYCGFDEFEHTTVGLLAVAGGSFPTTALEHLRSVCRSLNAWVLPHQAALPNVSSRFEGGELVDETMAERVDTLGVRLVQYGKIEPDPMTVEACENVGADD